ncbi:MAG: acyl-CoA dehydrogenase family protein, partial [Planctomycetota bacterium]
MDFQLSDTDIQIRDAAKAYAEEAVAPLAAQMDRSEEFDLALWEEARRRKLVGIAIPTEYGGNGLGNLQLSIVLEEINRVCASTGITLSVHNSLLASPIINFGNDDQKKRFLPKIASGEWLGCYSLTEPHSGSDAAGLTCKAERKGDVYVINGVKSWITSAQFAGVVLLMARTGEHKTRGITSFVVPMDTPGIQVSKYERKSGLRGSKTNELTFTNVEVPAENVLAEEGMGFKIALNTLDGGRIGVGAQSLGIGRACLESSVEMLKKYEEAGGNGPILERGKNYIAEMKTHLDAARLLIWRAASLRDRKQNCTAEGAMAKLMASTTANRAADMMMQVWGETGYSAAYPVERYMRDARITEIYEGTTEIQKLVISR